MKLNPQNKVKQKHNFFNFKNTKPTFNKGICISDKVLLGVIKAVSNSSAENSTAIFKRGLKTYNTESKNHEP